MKSIKITIAILSFSLFFQTVYGQRTANKIEYPQIPTGESEQIKDFVPVGWEIAEEIKGDLNGDKLVDKVLVLKNPKVELYKEKLPEQVSNPQILVVLLKQIVGFDKRESFDLVSENNLILTSLPDLEINPTSVFSSLKIENGNLKIERTFTYKNLNFSFSKKYAFEFSYQNSEIVLVAATYDKKDDKLAENGNETSVTEFVEYKLADSRSSYLLKGSGKYKVNGLTITQPEYKEERYFSLTKLPLLESLTSWEATEKKINDSNITFSERKEFAPNKEDFPQLPKIGNKVADFIPSNWEIFKEVSGDFNDDKIADTVLILKDKNPKFVQETEGVKIERYPRILVALLKDKESLKLVEQNNSLIPYFVPAFDDPFNSVEIDRNGDIEVKLNFNDKRLTSQKVTEQYKFSFSNSAFNFYLSDAYQKIDEPENKYDILNKEYDLRLYQAIYQTYDKGKTNGWTGNYVVSEFDMYKYPPMNSIGSWSDVEKEVDELKVKPPKVDAETLAQMTEDKQIMFYDGRINANPYSNLIDVLPMTKKKKPQGFTEKMNQKIISQAVAIKKLALKDTDSMKDSENFDCPHQKEPIIKMVNGSFTKPNTKQTASLYKLYACDSSNTEIIGGIIIAEGNNIVSHYLYASTWREYEDIQTANDVNQNGLTEIIILNGRIKDGIEIVEIAENKMNFLGHISGLNDFRYGGHTFGLNGERTNYPDNYWGDVISVVPGKTPYFFRKKYFRRGGEEWKAESKAELISLSPAENSHFNVFRQMK